MSSMVCVSPLSRISDLGKLYSQLGELTVGGICRESLGIATITYTTVAMLSCKGS